MQLVNTPMRASQNRDPELAKLFFMVFSEKAGRMERLGKYIDTLRSEYQTMKFIYDEGITFSTEEKYQDIANYQLLSAKYGVDTLKFHVDWYTKVLEDMKEGKI